MAASRSVTAGSTSYLTRTRSAASSASYRLRARTTATGSPEYLTIPWASNGWVTESRPGNAGTTPMRGVGAGRAPAVKTATVAYQWRSPWQSPEQCFTDNDFQFEVHTRDVPLASYRLFYQGGQQ